MVVEDFYLPSGQRLGSRIRDRGVSFFLYGSFGHVEASKFEPHATTESHGSSGVSQRVFFSP